ncbi:unnamed protein product [Clonostachys rhizophaga]|uniref:Zn(2)-C6 fungal-type domain-containing protein n=1 Tax=Clonostachys rhizophaga TaxID=160324 RepID=A0A9N9VNW2_9HYPO|nr:unnamed protein product [Clonostachys rhizophaga]
MSASSSGQHKYACSSCARRKIKCDKADPCSNCSKAEVECLYEEHPPPRPRKRAADEDLIARLGAYESLLRDNNIDFSHFSHSWIPSDLQGKLKYSASGSESPTLTPGTNNPATSKDPHVDNRSAEWERCLWTSLPMELKFPPTRYLHYSEDPCLYPIPPLHSIMSSGGSTGHKLHPEPRQIYRLWQQFVEAVNPLIKIVHVPTMQQQILEASWGLENISPPLAALMFSIYSLAVISLSSAQCEATYGEPRPTLITRYRVAALSALIAADFLTTKDLQLLTAFALFLLTDPDSEFTSSLTPTAVRIGQKMGLHKPSHPKVSFFESEMRIRLWWQLNALDSRARGSHVPGMRPPALVEFGDIRVPLNVNDSDLHPEMTEPPTEHVGPTEMTCVLIKFHIFQWLRHSSASLRVFEGISNTPEKSKRALEMEDDLIDKLESIYHEKFLQYLDLNIPLHALSNAIAILASSRLRYMAHHPRFRAVTHNGAVYMKKEEGDLAFNSAVTSLEKLQIGEQSQYSRHLFTHISSTFQLETNVYITSELRRRYSGERVEMAWKLVQDFFDEYEKLLSDEQNSFFVALGDITLEAWEARRRYFQNHGQGAMDYTPLPRFIELLWNKQQLRNGQSVQVATTLDSQNLDTFELPDVHDVDFDWESWSSFWRF